LSLDENEVNDDEDTEIEIMRPKRGLDQNDKTNQTPFNEKSGNDTRFAMTIRARTNTLVFPTVFTFTNAINGIAIWTFANVFSSL
jgi:hypothetical protein